ncbi:flocculation protein FLO11 isoform X2 [Hyalella azteca]|uniref:Flocculation protein FLO11 isoform X2 n=1 Tax=Hyalella azteca TaxID=294128 RepID=A0A8B7N4J8_HYAAZ|nr:flocculation protein FLO11 isoform X2 [Hyalella azteca]
MKSSLESFGALPMLLDMSTEECLGALRSRELLAYSHMVGVFRAQGELSKEKRKILSEIQHLLGITPERHKAEVRRAVSDEILYTIAHRLCGGNTQADWAIEARRLVPLLPRAIPQIAYTAYATKMAQQYFKMNMSKPQPSETGQYLQTEDFGRSSDSTESDNETEGLRYLTDDMMPSKLQRHHRAKKKKSKRRNSAGHTRMVSLNPAAEPAAASHKGSGHSSTKTYIDPPSPDSRKRRRSSSLEHIVPPSVPILTPQSPPMPLQTPGPGGPAEPFDTPGAFEDGDPEADIGPPLAKQIRASAKSGPSARQAIPTAPPPPQKVILVSTSVASGNSGGGNRVQKSSATVASSAAVPSTAAATRVPAAAGRPVLQATTSLRPANPTPAPVGGVAAPAQVVQPSRPVPQQQQIQYTGVGAQAGPQPALGGGVVMTRVRPRLSGPSPLPSKCGPHRPFRPGSLHPDGYEATGGPGFPHSVMPQAPAVQVRAGGGAVANPPVLSLPRPLTPANWSSDGAPACTVMNRLVATGRLITRPALVHTTTAPTPAHPPHQHVIAGTATAVYHQPSSVHHHTHPVQHQTQHVVQHQPNTLQLQPQQQVLTSTQSPPPQQPPNMFVVTTNSSTITVVTRTVAAPHPVMNTSSVTQQRVVTLSGGRPAVAGGPALQRHSSVSAPRPPARGGPGGSSFSYISGSSVRSVHISAGQPRSSSAATAIIGRGGAALRSPAGRGVATSLSARGGGNARSAIQTVRVPPKTPVVGSTVSAVVGNTVSGVIGNTASGVAGNTLSGLGGNTVSGVKSSAVVSSSVVGGIKPSGVKSGVVSGIKTSGLVSGGVKASGVVGGGKSNVIVVHRGAQITPRPHATYPAAPRDISTKITIGKTSGVLPARGGAVSGGSNPGAGVGPSRQPSSLLKSSLQLPISSKPGTHLSSLFTGDQRHFGGRTTSPSSTLDPGASSLGHRKLDDDSEHDAHLSDDSTSSGDDVTIATSGGASAGPGYQRRPSSSLGGISTSLSRSNSPLQRLLPSAASRTSSADDAHLSYSVDMNDADQSSVMRRHSSHQASVSYASAPDGSTSTAESTTGNAESSTGNAESTTGTTESTTGNAESTTGMTESTTGTRVFSQGSFSSADGGPTLELSEDWIPVGDSSEHLLGDERGVAVVNASNNLRDGRWLEEAMEVLGRGDKESARSLLLQAGIEFLDSPADAGSGAAAAAAEAIEASGASFETSGASFDPTGASFDTTGASFETSGASSKVSDGRGGAIMQPTTGDTISEAHADTEDTASSETSSNEDEEPNNSENPTKIQASVSEMSGPNEGGVRGSHGLPTSPPPMPSTVSYNGDSDDEEPQRMGPSSSRVHVVPSAAGAPHLDPTTGYFLTTSPLSGSSCDAASMRDTEEDDNE